MHRWALLLRIRRTAALPSLTAVPFAYSTTYSPGQRFLSIATEISKHKPTESFNMPRQGPPARGKSRGRGNSMGGSGRRQAPSPGRRQGIPASWKEQPFQKKLSKRKREDDWAQRGPPARRQKFNKTQMEYDLASIQRKMSLPTKKQFPAMPRDAVYHAKNSLFSAVKPSARFVHNQNGGNHHHECYLSCQIPGYDDFDVKGEGYNKISAERAAYAHLLSKLFDSGFLSELWPQSEKIDHQTLKDEKDAKIDIYDYAARFGLVPQFSTAQKQFALRKNKKLFEVKIELPEQKISVTGRAISEKVAEVSAALKFKNEAEQYLASLGGKALVLKDSTALNVANAKKFFEFYKDVDRNTSVAIRCSTNSSSCKAQAVVNGEPMGEEVTMAKKAKAEDVAYLVAAIHITKESPELIPRFLKALRAGNGNILRMVPPIDLIVDANSIYAMEDTVVAARRSGLPDQVQELDEEEKAESRQHRPRAFISGDEAQRRSQKLLDRYQAYQSNAELESLRKAKSELPMSQYATEVLEIVDGNMHSIIIGATGSGKTTQVPQILLERAIQAGDGASCNIVCTQPRRIAATSVAKRVAQERAEKLQDTVGYHVRFDPKPPRPGGSITYCTTGILLQQLQHDPDDVLDKVSHLIIDEVHERDMIIDFLLIVLKKVMGARIDAGKEVPKVVLMSATIDSELFASYFKNTHPDLGEVECPTLSVPGRAFPVKEQHLEAILETLDQKYGEGQLGLMYRDKPTVDYFEYEKTFAKQNPVSGTADVETQETEAVIDWKSKTSVTEDGDLSTNTDAEDALVPLGLVATTIAHIAKTTDEGAVLVFLPGLEEMVAVDAMLREKKPLGVDFLDEAKYKTYMLHSSIRDSQSTVFDSVPEGCRKIILGTNIAETSITIPDVQFVVDTGKLREKRYDQIRRITKLQCTWVSKSNAKQRAGRAGRVQNGNYYALFSKARHQHLRAVGLPELLRSDLQETCLDIKAQAFDTPIQEFLAGAIESPSPAAVETAVENLIQLDALTDDEDLTALGRLLASLPVHPSLGKMIVLGMIYRCLDPMIILGAAAGDRSLFTNPLGSRDAAKAAKMSFVQQSDSDHIALLNAFDELRRRREPRNYGALKSYAFENFLHTGAFQSIDNTAKQIEEILIDAGLVPKNDREPLRYGGQKLNENADATSIVKALIVAGMYPNLGLTTNNMLFRTPGEKNCMVHPSSVLADQFGRPGRDQPKHHRGQDIPEAKLVAYTTLAKSNDGHSTFIRDGTIIDPVTAALFGGRLYAPKTSNRIVEMDGWLQFYLRCRIQRSTGTLVGFREAMERMQIEAFRDLSEKEPLADDQVRAIFAKGLKEVLSHDGVEASAQFEPKLPEQWNKQVTSQQRRFMHR